jgi:DNA replication protein DnaC
MKDCDLLPKIKDLSFQDALGQCSERLAKRCMVSCQRTLGIDGIESGLLDSLIRTYTGARAFLHKRVGVYYHGPNGVGKSYAMSALCLALASQNYSCLFLTVNQWIDAYLQKDKMMFSDHQSIWSRSMSVHFLFIDDLGKESNNTFIKETLERMVKERDNAGQYTSTFYTSNLPFPTPNQHNEFYAMYGKSFATLIQRNCIGKHVPGQSRRDNVRKLAKELA